jgi:hypothetical protein
MYSESIWRKRYLIPLWTVQLTFIVVLIGVLAVAMMEYAGDHNGKNNPYVH